MDETTRIAKVKLYFTRFQARHHKAKDDLSYQDLVFILERAEGKCEYCGDFVGMSKLIIEHLVPLSRGGANTRSNIKASCFYCNMSKGSKKPNALNSNDWFNAAFRMKPDTKNLLLEYETRLSNRLGRPVSKQDIVSSLLFMWSETKEIL